jgi:hyperosmotically inducible protein
MSILRFLLVVIAVVIVGAFALGYLGGQRMAFSWPGSSAPTAQQRVEPRADTSETVARARERGAEIGERAAEATTKVQESVNEAAVSTKIKAKMALDDSVKASAINVSTRGTTVTLSGTVASQAERERALALARETNGVTSVVDALHVR